MSAGRSDSRAAWKWFTASLVAFLVGIGGLSIVSALHFPCANGGAAGRSFQFLVAADRGAIVAEQARASSQFMRGCRNVSAAPFTLNAARTRIQQEWLWADNLFVLVYTTMFVSGFLIAHRTLVERRNEAAATLALSAALPVAVVGALADFKENALFLAGLGDPSMIGVIASQVVPWTIAKFLLFTTNALVLIAAAAFKLLRQTHRPTRMT
jgi:hypothetical protein